MQRSVHDKALRREGRPGRDRAGERQPAGPCVPAAPVIGWNWEVFTELFIPDPQRLRIPFMVDLVAEWPAAVYLTFQRPLRSWQRTPAPCFGREMPPRPSRCEGGRRRWRESGAHSAITRSFLREANPSQPTRKQSSSQQNLNGALDSAGRPVSDFITTRSKGRPNGGGESSLI